MFFETTIRIAMINGSLLNIKCQLKKVSVGRYLPTFLLLFYSEYLPTYLPLYIFTFIWYLPRYILFLLYFHILFTFLIVGNLPTYLLHEDRQKKCIQAAKHSNNNDLLTQ